MPISRLAYASDYYCDKTCHKFWKKNATKVCDDEEDITGKIVIVTGSNCGIGKEVAYQLAKRGAVVIMTVRDMERGNQAKVDIEGRIAQSCVLVVKKLDLGDIESIYSFVNDFEANYSHLNLLVNNAGIMSATKKRETTKDGFELQVGVNHLGTFLLTKLLLESLKKGVPSRVVTLASCNLSIATFDFDNFMEENKKKSGMEYLEQYNMSKLAIAVCIRKLVSDLRKSGDEGWNQVKFYLMCPGYVRTPLFRNDEGCCRKCTTKVTICIGGISVHKGAETVCYLSLSRSVAESYDLGNAEMYRFMKIWGKGEKVLKQLDGSEEQDRVYKLTEQLLGLDGKEGETETASQSKSVPMTIDSEQ